jgi:hypothetical protein
MEVSGGGKTTWDGTKVKEKLGTGTNDCDKTPGCANANGQGGNAGSTFTVGAASPAFKHPKRGEVVPAMPAKQNCFYDIHIMGGSGRLVRRERLVHAHVQANVRLRWNDVRLGVYDQVRVFEGNAQDKAGKDVTVCTAKFSKA